MKSRDRYLGMNQSISRRDLIQGLGGLAMTPLIPGRALADAVLATEQNPGNYPPALTGLRGNHSGSFEVSHALSREGKADWGTPSEPDPGIYDLVVVGAGISGLAAAHFFRKQQPNARILILDNHDDFGGHAKRNEFIVGGDTILGYGGSQTLEEPFHYPDSAKELLADLGVDLSVFKNAYDGDFYKRNNLTGGVFFNQKDWGENRLIPYDLATMHSYLPLAPSKLSDSEAIAQMPMSERARVEFLRLQNARKDNLVDLSADEKEMYLQTISYKDYLSKHLGISEPEIFAVLKDLTTDSGVGFETASAGLALQYLSLPGYQAIRLDSFEVDEPYIHHFPDGNASIARQLVRQMIPAVAAGSTMEDLVQARFDYSKLDRANNPVRLRLNSTVTNVTQSGGAANTKAVQVSYVRGGKAYRVQARSCILACYNAMIPALCPQLSTEQKHALANQVKSPILYTTVALSNWRAWSKLGVGAIAAPGSYHTISMLDFPVSLGGYQFSAKPDEPIIVHMERFPHSSEDGLSKQEKLRRGRHDLLATPFETIERNVRSQLADMLGEGGFDPGKDIAGITVNRWAHGYSYYYDFTEHPYYPDWNDERYPHVQARKPFGRIAIANSDAAASATLPSAVEQAHRAVSELL